MLPATVPDGSVWSVMLCTQLGGNGSSLVKEPRTATMSDNFVVGDVADTPGGGGEDDRPVIE